MTDKAVQMQPRAVTHQNESLENKGKWKTFLFHLENDRKCKPVCWLCCSQRIFLSGRWERRREKLMCQVLVWDRTRTEIKGKSFNIYFLSATAVHDRPLKIGVFDGNKKVIFRVRPVWRVVSGDDSDSQPRFQPRRRSKLMTGELW